MITLEEVQELVLKISKIKNDPEIAHSMEDALYVEVLKTIAELPFPATANDNFKAQELAEAALKTRQYIKTRWYA